MAEDNGDLDSASNARSSRDVAQSMRKLRIADVEHVGQVHTLLLMQAAC